MMVDSAAVYVSTHGRRRQRDTGVSILQKKKSVLTISNIQNGYVLIFSDRASTIII